MQEEELIVEKMQAIKKKKIYLFLRRESELRMASNETSIVYDPNPKWGFSFFGTPKK